MNKLKLKSFLLLSLFIQSEEIIEAEFNCTNSDQEVLYFNTDDGSLNKGSSWQDYPQIGDIVRFTLKYDSSRRWHEQNSYTLSFDLGNTFMRFRPIILFNSESKTIDADSLKIYKRDARYIEDEMSISRIPEYHIMIGDRFSLSQIETNEYSNKTKWNFFFGLSRDETVDWMYGVCPNVSLANMNTIWNKL